MSLRRTKGMIGLAAFLLTAGTRAQAAPGEHFILLPKDLPPPR